ncbi:ABC transporter ATP-binding protein [Marinifilum sp. JC120]|nr:ABC transporter ATP-binding protein [Marinifilum sp. JC120]
MVGIEVRGLSKTYQVDDRSIDALSNVSFTIEPGSFTAIVGYSGCGKTTLFRHLARLESPDAGSHAFLSQAGASMSDSLCLGMMFQEPRLLPWLTVAGNIKIALRHSRIFNHEKAINDALDTVGLAKFKNAYPKQLSGGMAQRVALARALCRQPDLLLMDEPFGALDALTKIQLQRQLAQIWAARPTTILFITHDISEAVLLADRVLVMADGRIVDEIAVPLARPRSAGMQDVEQIASRLMQRIVNRTYSQNGSVQ